jgi:cellulose synthase/poly-beta-1,6-N-acetylglucosamine synthase-like glycosyltransferase
MVKGDRMKLLFWSSACLIFFAYAGYPIIFYFRAKFWPRPVHRACIFPRVTIVLAVHNEEKSLPGKLHNLAALDYLADRLEVIVISDGSTDETNKIANAWQHSGYRVVILPEHRGKAHALNYGIAEAQGEIVCFTDARQKVASDGLKNLVANFADSSVGCASGELMLRGDRNTPSSDGVRLYWRLEKNIRNWEGLAGSTVGATGAFYAVRKDLLLPLPEGTILDDVYIPLQVARKSSRVIFDPRAVAWDDFTPSPKQEFHRKVRTLAGTYQLLLLAPWVLTSANPLRLRLVCHRLIRLLVPFALVGVFISTMWLRQGIYELVLVLQVALYMLATLSALRAQVGFLSRMSNISLAFILLNTADTVAFIYFITGRKAVWVR